MTDHMLTHTEGEALAAMSLWEDLVIKDRPTTNGHIAYHAYRTEHGVAQTRDRVLEMAVQCEAAWEFSASDLGFGAAYDWEFVPLYVELCVAADFAMIYKTPIGAARVIMAAHELRNPKG